MATPETSTQPEPIPGTELAKLLQAPVTTSAGRQLLGIFKDFQAGPEPAETLRLCRRTVLVLDNLGLMDGDTLVNGRSDYAAWYHGERKKLMETFRDAASAIEASLTATESENSLDRNEATGWTEPMEEDHR